MEAEVSRPRRIEFHKGKRRIRFRRYLLIALVVLTAGYDLWAAADLTSAEPDDAKIYSQIAKDVVDQHVYSTDSASPFEPTLIRLPGYPLLLAAIYSMFGEGNKTAVQVVQGILHLLSAVAAGLVAWNWCSGRRRRRRAAAVSAFVLAAGCPFTLIYTGVLLTETATMFLMASLALAATLGVRNSGRRSLFYWGLAGVIAGTAVEFRPDAGIFAAGIGIVLVVSSLRSRPIKTHIPEALSRSAVYSFFFILILTPWTIRNYRVFGLFQPLAPADAEMPNEFVPHGYFLWLRTWLTDIRYVNSLEWALEKERIDIRSIPDSAFASEEERERVSALIDEYNNSDPDHPFKMASKEANDEQDSANSGDTDQDQGEADNDEDQEEADELDLKITPEVDAAFAQVAYSRIQNDPFNFYVILPARRMVNMWFDTHSEYYSFSGELFPVKELDSETAQNLWLPLFIIIVWAYSIMALFGFLILLISRRPNSRVYALIPLVIFLPRAIFIARLENPEPRYFVEYFVLAAVLGGIFLSRFAIRFGRGRLSISLSYGRERPGN